jgi:hypothetical protein
MSIKTLRPAQFPRFVNTQIKRHPKSQKSFEESVKRTSPEGHRKPGLPIPKGETPYAMAKNAEYKYRDLDKAEHYYRQAISQGDRPESAVKDLASLMHQRGKTKEACEVLEDHRDLFKNDFEKYTNLYNTLKKQIDSTGNCQNKCLKMSGLLPDTTCQDVRSFFTNSVRIQGVELHCQELDGKIIFYALLNFNSHSSARKTLEGFHHWDKFKVEWVSPLGNVVGDAHYARHKMEEYRKHHPTFDYMIFERDPQGYVFSLPVDLHDYLFRRNDDDEKSAEILLGSGLYEAIFKEDLFKDLE